MKNRVFSVLTVLIAISVSAADSSFGRVEDASSQQQPVVVQSTGSVVVSPTPSAILAPQGLTAREKNQIEQQYKYNVRNKGSILTPYVGAEAVEGNSDLSESERSEQEQLYRYFTAADKLYKDGRIEEAIEILQYIADKNPEDQYVRSYLKKARNTRTARKKQWSSRSDGDANLLKRQAIRNLLSDGIDYYKQKRFDMALLKFTDVLASDPNNAQARRYYDKLKEHYAKEVRVGNIVDSYEAGSRQPEEMKMLSAAEKLLDKEEPIDASGVAGKPLSVAAKKLLDEEDIQSIIAEKRLSAIMDEADLGMEVKDIVTRNKEDDRRRDLYTLGPGDSIQISVRDHPELSGAVTVRVDGNVVLPLVNDPVKLKDLTVDEAVATITEVMKKYVRYPSVSVGIYEYRSKKFYVIDEVGCTPYPITRANLTLRDALFVADWGDGRALGRVIVMKPDKLHPMVRKVDAYDMIYRGDLTNNVRIENGDVIYVPMTVAVKISKTISDTLSPVIAVKSVRDNWIDVKFNSQDGWRNLGKMPRTVEQQVLWQAPDNNTIRDFSGGSYLSTGSVISNLE